MKSNHLTHIREQMPLTHLFASKRNKNPKTITGHMRNGTQKRRSK